MNAERVVIYCGNCANCSAPVMTQREAWWPVSFPMPCPVCGHRIGMTRAVMERSA